jgi:signal transduction histidine kinase/CheY-like chemotaxis protein
MVGKNVLSYVDPNDVTRFQRMLMDPPSTAIAMSTKFRKKDGTYCWLEATVKLLTSGEGSTRIIAFAKDVTQLIDSIEKEKKLERQLIRSQKIESLGTLVGGIAHDFNNILQIIISYTAMMQESQQTPKELKRLDKVMHAAERGTALVRQLLTFARKTEFKVEPVDINGTITEFSGLLRETFPKDIAITEHLAADLPMIFGDQGQIHQVLLNLCVNARDAMPNGGSLTISTSVIRYGDMQKKYPQASAALYVHLRVSDSGMGMDAATKGRIFEPFFTTKGVDKGTGLGLSVVFSVVENHNGIMDVESEVGEGTTMHVFLPASNSKARPLADVDIPSTSMLYGSESILLVEDEEATREFLMDLLSEYGYRVYVAKDGNEGMEIFTKFHHSIELIISDIGLPKIAGDSLAVKIRERSLDHKIIMLSGHIDLDVRRKLLEIGVNSILEKPSLPLATLRVIRDVLDDK